MNKNLTGKLLLSFAGVFTAVSPYLADWNETHIYNPFWTPHAKFHNAQTMLFGAFLGVLTLAFVWAPRGNRTSLVTAAVLASLYWITQLLSLTFPGTALADPEPQGLQMPVLLGVQITQIHLDVFLVLLVGLGYSLASRPLAGAPVGRKVSQPV